MLSGEATVREIAAYLLDHDGFAGVSQTCLVKVQAGQEVFGGQDLSGKGEFQTDSGTMALQID